MKNTVFYKKILPLTLTTTLAFGLSGCTDEEVNTTIAIVAIGAAVAAGAAAGAHAPPDRHDHGPGHGPGRGGPGGDHGPGLRPLEANDNGRLLTPEEMDQMNRAAQARIDVEAFAERFDLSLKSSQTFVTALEQARNGDNQALADLGFSRSDLKRLQDYQMPSENAVQKVALRIQAPRAQTAKMLETLVKTAAQKRDMISDQIQGFSTSPTF